METLGCIGEQLQGHVGAAAERATEQIETPLIDVSLLRLSDPEKVTYDCLNDEPLHIEQIIAEADLSPGRINASLISLRLKGLIKQLPGGMFLKL